MSSDQISRYLGLPPMGIVPDAEIVEEKKQPTVTSKHISKQLSKHVPKEPETRSEQAENDYDYARKNMYDVIEKGTHALEELLGVATQSQHPRAYEVLATTMKTLVDANKELVGLSKKKVEEEKLNDEPQTGSGGVTNNNLFVGTTHDLLKVLADMRKNGNSK
jgi:hypothetical protein